MDTSTPGTVRVRFVALVAAVLLAAGGLAGCGSSSSGGGGTTAHFDLTATPTVGTVSDLGTNPATFSTTVTVNHTAGVGWILAVSSLETLSNGFGASGYTTTSTSSTTSTIASFLGGSNTPTAPGTQHVIDEFQLYDQDPTSGTASGTVWFITSLTDLTYSYNDVTAVNGTATAVGPLTSSNIAVTTFTW